MILVTESYENWNAWRNTKEELYWELHPRRFDYDHEPQIRAGAEVWTEGQIITLGQFIPCKVLSGYRSRYIQAILRDTGCI